MCTPPGAYLSNRPLLLPYWQTYTYSYRSIIGLLPLYELEKRPLFCHRLQRTAVHRIFTHGTAAATLVAGTWHTRVVYINSLRGKSDANRDTTNSNKYVVLILIVVLLIPKKAKHHIRAADMRTLPCPQLAMIPGTSWTRFRKPVLVPWRVNNIKIYAS